MHQLNRSAIIVRAKQPFLDWVHSTNEPEDDARFTLNDINAEPAVYLIQEFADFDSLDQQLTGLKPELFEAMLDGWYTDEKKWPANRTASLFDEWFTVEAMSMVVDLEASDLTCEEM